MRESKQLTGLRVNRVRAEQEWNFLLPATGTFPCTAVVMEAPCDSTMSTHAGSQLETASISTVNPDSVHTSSKCARAGP